MKKRNDIETIFEDDDILVISKPAGVLTVSDRYDLSAPNLRSILKKKYGDIFVVHRLDKDTSGVMVFAKNAEAHKNLNQQFQEHTIKKIYHVLVSGVINQDTIDIDIPLMVDPANSIKMKPSVRGKESLTKLKVLSRFRVATLVECQLVTGRHHQIRAHCAAIGHPLLVDELYGTSNEFLVSSIKRRFNLKKDDIEKPVISRVSMHSNYVECVHPVTNQTVNFSAAYPKDFQALLQVLEKYSSTLRYNK